MKHSCPEYAALILHGQITLDDVPESRQQSARFFLDRCGPDGEPTDPIQVTVGFMKRVERMRKEIHQLRSEAAKGWE